MARDEQDTRRAGLTVALVEHQQCAPCTEPVAVRNDPRQQFHAEASSELDAPAELLRRSNIALHRSSVVSNTCTRISPATKGPRLTPVA